MNKKMILMLVALLGMSSLMNAGENPPTPPTTFLSKIASCFKTTGNVLFNWPTLLLQKISPTRFEGMATWKAAGFDALVYAIIIAVAKVSYDKYQERKRRSKEEKAIKDILAKFEEGEDFDEDEEVVEAVEAEPAN